MNKLAKGSRVTVKDRDGVITDIKINNGHTLYIVQTDEHLIACTRSSISMTPLIIQDKEPVRIRKADVRKPQLSELLMAVKPDLDPIWQDAACTNSDDPDMFWLDYNIEDKDLPRLARALTLCSECPLQTECLKMGLTDSELNDGIFGGYLPGERIMMRYKSNRRGVQHRNKVKIAMALRRRLKEYVHAQMRKDLKQWAKR
jgi:hypothetical protein